MERTIFEINSNIKIIHNDCLAELRQLNENIADIVLTSPPYNIGLIYNEYNDTKTSEAYLNWMHDIAIEIKRILKPDGSFFLNIGNTNTDPSIADRVCSVISDVFILQNNIIWVKNISIGDTSYGHFKPINSSRYLNNCWEKIFHFTKNCNVKLDRLAIGVPYTHKSNIERWKHDSKETKIDRRCAGNCWFIPYKTVTSRKDHPAGFPIELPLRCIRLHGVQPNMLVIDPFLGCGSTLQACARLNINGWGIEMDESYCRIAVDRVRLEYLD